MCKVVMPRPSAGAGSTDIPTRGDLRSRPTVLRSLHDERRETRDRIERLCAGDLSPKVLREKVIAQLRPVLRYDAHVWLLTDPVTRVGTSPLADVPMMPWARLPELGRLRYLTHVNRWTDLMDAGRSTGLLLEGNGG